MDATDARILCEMAFGTTSFTAIHDRHVSPSEIGRRLGMDEKTVRLRVKRMEEDGFIKYYQVLPSLSLFGLKSTGFYRFESLNLQTKFKLIEYLLSSAFILETLDYLGQAVSVSIAGASSSDVGRVAESIASRFELSQWNLHHEAPGACESRLDRLDWRIIKELRYSARMGTVDLANALSITPRMADYRTRKLLDSGAITVRATINPRKQTGLVFYELELSVDDADQSSVARRLGAEHGEKLWSTLPSKGLLLASLFAFSLGEPEESAIDSFRISGVKACSLYILKEVIEPRGPNWIDRLIDQELDRV